MPKKKKSKISLVTLLLKNIVLINIAFIVFVYAGDIAAKIVGIEFENSNM